MIQSHQLQLQQQQQHREDRQEDLQNVPAAANGSSWRVAYLLQSSTGGWRRHKSYHTVSLEDDDHLCVKDQTTSRLQEHVHLGSVDVLQAAFVAAADGQSIVRFTLAGQPVRKFALITDCGRGAAELCHALYRRGIKVGGMEDLPDAMYLRGSDQRSVEALEANIPNLSRPEVQAYIVRLLFQDSFHQFVHDLSEMFSHVQSNLPLPCTTPRTPSSSTTTATNPAPPPTATATTRATVAPPLSTGRAGSSSGPTTASTTTRPARNSHEGQERPGGGSGGENVGGGSSGRSGEQRRAERRDEVGGRVGGVNVGGRGRRRGVETGGRGRGAGRGKGGRGAGAGRGRGGKRTVGGACTSMSTEEAPRAKSGGAVSGHPDGQDVRDSGNSNETANINKRRARPRIGTSTEASAQQGTVSKRPCARKEKVVGGDRRVAATHQSLSNESLSSSMTQASKQSRPKRPHTALEPQRTAAVAVAATATAAADDGVYSSPFVLSPQHGNGERDKLPSGRKDASDGDKWRHQQSRRPPAAVGRGKTSTMIPRGPGAGVRGPRKENSGVRAKPTVTKGAVGAAGGARKPAREGQKGGGEGGNKKPKGNNARGKKATTNGPASASANRTTPAVGEKGRNQWKTGMPMPVGPPTPSGRMAGLTKMLMNTWNQVYRHRSGWAFWKGVDPEMVPGYLDVVKHPIDLQSIQERLKNDIVHYTSKSMFYDDLVLMCRNALLFNKKGTEYHSAAKDLLQFVQSKFGSDM